MAGSGGGSGVIGHNNNAVFPSGMTRSSNASNGAAAATSHLHLSNQSATDTQVTLSMIIEFTPLQGSRLKRMVHESGYLNKDEREWLTQYITKDLIQLQTLAMHIKMQQQEQQQQLANRSSNNSTLDPTNNNNNGGFGGINSTPQRGSINGAKASPSPVPAAANGGGAAAGPASNNNNAGGGSARAEVMSDDSSSFIKVISLEQLRTTVVVMFFALDAGGGGDDGNGSSSGGGSGGFLSAAASGQAHMYAVAVALNDSNPIRLRLAVPSIRDWMFHSHQYIVALADVEYEDEDGGGAGGDDDDIAAGVVDVEQEWVTKLEELKSLVDVWTNHGFIKRSEIDLDATIFAKPDWNPVVLYNVLTAALSHHRCILRSKNQREVQVWLNTLALFYSDDRLLFSSKTCYVPDPLNEPPISGGGGGQMLSHHDDEDAVVISKGGGGVSSAASPLSSSASSSSRQYIAAPDFNLQGTTAEVNQILQHHVLHFRFAPVIIDVSKSIDDPYHFFPKDRQVKFTEVRERIFRRLTPLKPPFGAIFLHDKSRPAANKSSSLLASICGRLKLIAHPSVVSSSSSSSNPGNSPGIPSPGTVPSNNASIVSMRTVTPGGGGGHFATPPAGVAVAGGGGGAPPAFLVTPRNSVDQIDSGGGGHNNGNFPFYPHAALLAQHQTDTQKVANIVTAIAQWRRQLVLRTLSYYYYTVEFRFKTDSQSSFSPPMFKEVADDAMLQVAVDFFAQIQEQKEKHARNVLTEAFAW